ncbi:MAG: glucose-6-phosphate isomerase [Chloroflexota bacterium]|nr:glucose-6-phosphate isomerase [Chloroflexota bacterium]
MLGCSLSALGGYFPDMTTTFDDLRRHNVIERIWQKDHTVWKPDVEEIANRLGWLDSPDMMRDSLAELSEFSYVLSRDGFKEVVLLGMGGSSLGAEVLKQTFGSLQGHPKLTVLDSTVPDRIRMVRDSIDPRETLFMVASKSGTTIEPLSLFQYFREMVETRLGAIEARRNFVAITDSDTPLAKQAVDDGFRRLFLNPSDIGGRYSVLSYFGLVPASVMGLDIKSLLDSSVMMKTRCRRYEDLSRNPGVVLGAIMGHSVLAGRDKLTLVTSPSIRSFGLWVEQLLAESTGKEGTGIVPIIGEPLVDPSYYGDDRLFIHLRLAEDDNVDIDTAIDKIRVSGFPVIRLEMQDRYDLGAEFFRWEFATAVSGIILGVQPFDQPDVDKSKKATDGVLEEFLISGKLKDEELITSVPELLAKTGRGRYLAILAYLNESPELDKDVFNVRRRMLQKYGIATTFGYGPRYLHSTGQLHKGGLNSGLFLQVIQPYEWDTSIPGKSYSFGSLAGAQALGDLKTLLNLHRTVARISLEGNRTLSEVLGVLR